MLKSQRPYSTEEMLLIVERNLSKGCALSLYYLWSNLLVFYEDVLKDHIRQGIVCLRVSRNLDGEGGPISQVEGIQIYFLTNFNL